MIILKSMFHGETFTLWSSQRPVASVGVKGLMLLRRLERFLLLPEWNQQDEEFGDFRLKCLEMSWTGAQIVVQNFWLSVENVVGECMGFYVHVNSGCVNCPVHFRIFLNSQHVAPRISDYFQNTPYCCPIIKHDSPPTQNIIFTTKRPKLTCLSKHAE